MSAGLRQDDRRQDDRRQDDRRQDDLRKGWCPGALRPMAAKDGLLMRLRITGGIIAAHQATALADLAARFGNGLLDLSARGNLQVRGVREDGLPQLQDELFALGLIDRDVGGESVRNVLASPLAGLHDGLDIRTLTAALERRLVADEALHALPGKFGFLIDDGASLSLAGIAADVRFDWDGERFAIGFGGTRTQAIPAGRCAPSDLPGRAAQVALTFLSVTRGHPEVRRMRDVADAVAEACTDRERPLPLAGRGKGWGSLRACWPTEKHGLTPTPDPSPQGGGKSRSFAEQNRTPSFSRKREKEGAEDIVGPHIFASMPVLGLAAPFGRLDATMLRSAARLAKTTGIGELRLTPWRVILIPDAPAQASVPGFITDPADPRLAIAACVGADGCSRGTTSTQNDAARLAQSLRLDPGAGTRLHVSGCAKGCAKASSSPINLVANEGRYDIVRDGRPGDSPWRRGLGLDEAQEIIAAMMATA